MNVTAILATCGRHTLLERSVGLFLNQIQEKIGHGDHAYTPIYDLLVYNNSDTPIEAVSGIMLDVKGYRSLNIVNNNIDYQTGEPYKNLGAIYRDALTHIDNTDVIVHWDDDDLFLPNHLMEGLKGLERGSVTGEYDNTILAYKPAKSYYRHPGGIQLMSNTLEPSIFVKYDHIKQYGYSLTTTDQHLQWVNPLVYGSRIFVDENGPATLIYNWGDTSIPTFKTSGDPSNVKNFDNYRNFSKDHGDKILTPWTLEQLQPYYNLVNG